jgi:predicted metalloprotease
MRWEDFRRSDNVEDVRGEGYSGGGGGFGIPIGGGGMSIGTLVVLGLVGWALGIDPRILIGGAEIITGGDSHFERQAGPPPSRGTPSDDAGQFVAAVLGSTEDTWKEIFRAGGQTYNPARLRLFAGVADGGRCGVAQAAMGPFYCPPDKRVYELGILHRAQSAQASAGGRAAANRIQVRVELQADCFAGVWAHHAEKRHNFLEPGDVDAALQTASAIGDDTLQRRSQGHVVPDSFTHGSAEQRKRWFMTGFQQGRVGACNTFAADARL